MNRLNKIKHGYFAYLPAAEDLNDSIIEGFRDYEDDSSTRKTHYFKGRYENIYIDRAKIPALDAVISQATEYAATILELKTEQLQCGFWFNSMQSGHVTIAHTHDDDDELLSGVYYVEVPQNSGQLLLGASGKQETIEPEAGKMVFFKPDLLHEVTTNLSEHHRLSIGMNFGLKK